MLSKYTAIILSLVVFSSCLVECSKGHRTSHLISKRQALASVCNSNECKYGTCEILNQFAYKCHCQSGITGTNCDTIAAAGNPCSSNPCYGATSVCVNQGTVAFTCVCQAGLTGQTCRDHVGTCQCQNGGACSIVAANNYRCSCPSGFGGELCQFRTTLTSCQVLGCQNGGTCTILSICTCPTGFTGSLCELSSMTTTPAVTVPTISICAPGICLNGGVCIQLTPNIGYCQCRNGFYGLFCNFAPSVTTMSTPITTTNTVTTTTTTLPSFVRCNFPNPCLNDGTCTYNPLNNQIFCDCLPNFEGLICQTQVPFCQNSPCENGGICVPGVGNAGTCTCPTGFGGTYCEVGLSCPVNPCLNNQQCVQLNGQPICLCGAGFNLPFCS